MLNRNPAQSGVRNLIDRASFHVKHLFRLLTPAERPGMGAIPHADGVTFRVWAPHAEHLFVTGTFNHWSHWRTPLAPERGAGTGYWSATVPDARVGDEYKYVIRRDGETLLRTDPYAREVTDPHRNSVVCADGFAEGDVGALEISRRNLVIYELHIGTFNAPQVGKNGAHAPVMGTFASAIAKLPYLRELGVNAIEVMPVMEFAGDYSWGYNPGHPFAITRTYGGRAAFQALVKAAHAQGIAVIVDVVYNHFGPEDLSLWRFDGWHENDLGGIYFYNDWRAKTPWGDTRPDYGRFEVRRYLRDNVFFWLDEFQVDGLRWDATSYIRNAHGHDGDRGADLPAGWGLMQWINDEVHCNAPGRLSIAEDMQDNPWLTQPTHMGGAGFDSQWDAHFAHTIRRAVITPKDEDRDMHAVWDALMGMDNGDPFARVLYTESHDEVANGHARVPEEISPGNGGCIFARKRSILGAALVFTAPGIPMIFQGQEFLENGWFDDHVPLDWSRLDKHPGIWRLYRDLIALRRNRWGTTRGLCGHALNVFHTNDERKLIAFHRWDQGGGGDDVIVVANFAHRGQCAYTIGFPRVGVWRVRFNSDQQVYDPEFGGYACPDVVATHSTQTVDGMLCWGNVTIAPYSVLILSQDG